ncbi:sensor histidine kinase [Ulvibacterium marinum]|uniref:Histidine kinase n=1 Tax=Ulvibacterium marinum TaxID=2419782 RepID=A0A3B0C7F0_9FLAO|nr:histidine kinase [Ulvibacterium marinum]RKN79287.1 histidine kinase [Ulvibacterium marinum]
MLLNKEERIKYLGFDDLWFSIIGILIISCIAAYLFNDPLQVLSLTEKVFSWGVSLFFTIVDWLINRSIMIYLRKKYPAFSDDTKRITLFFLAIVGTVVSVDFLGGTLISQIHGVNYMVTLSRLKVLLPIILITIMSMAIYEAIYYNVRLKKSVREEEHSKRLLVQAQLDALLNQAQPHFFFNTLNTLRDIIDQNSKEEAKEFVDKLSDMYRFLLEAGNENLVLLKNELRFAKAYTHIQSERFGDNLKLNWDIPETFLNKMIVPMSLQLLLENAIKHNVISKAKPLTIHVAVRDNKLVVDNKIEPKSTKLPSTKVGLANIEKRYKLISGKSIEVKNDGSRFMVSLPLVTTLDKKN